MHQHFSRRLFYIIYHLLVLSSFSSVTNASQTDIKDYLVKGDRALSNNRLDEAIKLYSKGIELLPKRWSTQEDDQDDNEPSPDAVDIERIMSLHTNYATALSFVEGSSINVVNAYRTACICYRKWKRGNKKQTDSKPKKVAVQAFFFLGMTYQDLAAVSATEGTTDSLETQEEYLQHAVKAYAAATKLDPNHWSSYANMGVVLADVGQDGDGNSAASLQLFEEGVMSYQKAIELLLNKPTDPPENVNEVVAELQYRIGLCLIPFLFTTIANEKEEEYKKRKCDLPGVATERNCYELAAYQFHTALKYGQHEGALNALTMVTADADFGMSTDVKKVQRLFEDYSSSFETSLVDELKYNGFSRMRKLFDLVIAQQQDANDFKLVLDVGCGTGLAGEAFRNISTVLIGIDISPKIIEQAKQSHPVYDEYKVGDAIEVLQLYPKNASLIVAADTFIYFNDLSKLFAALAGALEEGGYVVFSLENVSKENERRLLAHKPEWKWQITPSGRIAHRKEYVYAVAGSHSLQVVQYEKLDGFRKENGIDVSGHFFVLKKISDSPPSNDEL